LSKSKARSTRLPAELDRAVQQEAELEGVTVGEYLRMLCEHATGVFVGKMPRGFAALTRKRRKEIAQMGVLARRESEW